LLAAEPNIVFSALRRDCRTADNPALVAALNSARTVIPVFVWAPEEEVRAAARVGVAHHQQDAEPLCARNPCSPSCCLALPPTHHPQGQFQPGRQSRWWCKHTVLCLSQRLQQLGSRLVVRRGRESVEALRQLVAETGAQAVFFNHLYDSISMVRDQQVKDALRAGGVLVSTFNADLLYEPWEVLDDQQQVCVWWSCVWWSCVCGDEGVGVGCSAGAAACCVDQPSADTPVRAPRVLQPTNPQPYTTFKAYWDRCLAMPYAPPLPLPEPSGPLPAVPADVASLAIREVGLWVLWAQ
jgi:hypothetical protein